MSNTMTHKTVFADTQVLIYAFERQDGAVIALLDDYFCKGHRLVVSEETLFEFAQSDALGAALHLTQSVVGLGPLWVRSFADIEAEELVGFVRSALHGLPPVRPAALCREFSDASPLSATHKLDPRSFVTFAFDRRTQAGISELHGYHARAVDRLTAATKQGSLTPDVKLRALRGAVERRLLRRTDHSAPLHGADLEAATKFCIKHKARMMRECPSFAVEYHLSDYRCSAPGRVARQSDSKDLTITAAAFPYVDSFLTNDGYLFGALDYVKTRLPAVSTQLVRAQLTRNAASQVTPAK